MMATSDLIHRVGRLWLVLLHVVFADVAPGTPHQAGQPTTAAGEICPGPGSWRGSAKTSFVWIPSDSSVVCPQPLDVSGAPSTLFLGDSTMFLLFNFDAFEKNGQPWCAWCTGASDFSVISLPKSYFHPGGARCSMLEYMKVDASQSWKPPNSSQGQGPEGFGLTHHYCTGCSSCSPMRVRCGAMFAEYLPVEYSNDNGMQSSVSGTTQGTVVDYISSGKHPKPDWIVLKKGIVWLATSAIKENPKAPWLEDKYPQRNPVITEWNDAVRELISKEFPQVWFLDAYKLSLIVDESTGPSHRDRIHLDRPYYLSVARILRGFFASQSSAAETTKELETNASDEGFLHTIQNRVNRRAYLDVATAAGDSKKEHGKPFRNAGMFNHAVQRAADKTDMSFNQPTQPTPAAEPVKEARVVSSMGFIRSVKKRVNRRAYLDMVTVARDEKPTDESADQTNIEAHRLKIVGGQDIPTETATVDVNLDVKQPHTSPVEGQHDE